MKKLFLGLGICLALLASPAWAQSVSQSGTVTPGHVASWTTNGVVQDGGTAAAGKLTTLGITSSGAQPLCITTNATTSPYNQLCMGIDLTTGAYIYNTSYNGATHVPFKIVNNGTTVFQANDSGFVFPNLTGYLYANGSSSVTASTTIPGTALSADTNFDTTGAQLKLASTTNGFVVANATGGTAESTPTALSTVIDQAIGATRGSVLYRGAAGWAIRTPGLAGQVFTASGAGNDPTWTTVAGTGTVTSVAISAPAIFTVSGSPVTSSGTLTLSLATEVANTVFSGPTSGAATTPTFRALVAQDLALGTTSISSASTTDLGAVTPTAVTVTGNATVTSFGTSSAGTIKVVSFTGNAVLSNSASLVLPNAQNYTTQNGDVFVFATSGSGNWYTTSYNLANGQSIINVNVPVRQTVLTGAVSSAGVPAYVVAGTGLNANLVATTTPVKMAFANGFGTGGSQDYIETLSADASSYWASLPANITVDYLAVTRTAPGTTTAFQTLAPPQYGNYYDQNQQHLLSFGTGNTSTSFIDDYGSSWTAVSGAKVTNSQFKFGTGALGGSGASNTLNGTSDYIKSSSVVYPFQNPEVEFTIRGWVYFTANPAATRTIMSVSNTVTNFMGLGVSSTGKLVTQVSSDCATANIVNAPGGTTMTTNAWHFVELNYDNATYRTYLDGVQESATVSSVRPCNQAAVMSVGSANGIATTFFAGYVDKFEFLPYVDHPAGTTYSVPVAAPSVTTAGYSQDFFDITKMVMQTPSAASTVAGNPPTWSTVNRVYLAEVSTSGAAVTVVNPYALQARYTSPWANTLPAVNTNTVITHYLGFYPTYDVVMEVQNVKSDAGFGSGTTLQGVAAVDTIAGPPTFIKNRSSSTIVASSGTAGSHAWALVASGGAFTALTEASWNYRIVAKRNW